MKYKVEGITIEELSQGDLFTADKLQNVIFRLLDGHRGEVVEDLEHAEPVGEILQLAPGDLVRRVTPV